MFFVILRTAVLPLSTYAHSHYEIFTQLCPIKGCLTSGKGQKRPLNERPFSKVSKNYPTTRLRLDSPEALPCSNRLWRPLHGDSSGRWLQLIPRLALKVPTVASWNKLSLEACLTSGQLRSSASAVGCKQLMMNHSI